MKTTTSPLLQLIRRSVEDQRVKQLTDQELLCRFRSDRDEAAFHTLLRRHGSMVLDVCRNVLGNEADAEDAFQATFLILAQKAGAIRNQASVGSWLHGVAYRTALKARAGSARRQKHEACAPSQPSSSASDDLTWREVQQVIHEELGKVAECYRAPLVLCYIEGKTQPEAATALGVSAATVNKRLEQGRARLRARLVRRGLGSAAVSLTAAWPLASTASAQLPLVLVAGTVKAAQLIATGNAVASVASAKVAALTEGVLKTMMISKLKAVVAVVLLLGFIGTGATVLTSRLAMAQGEQQPAAEGPVKDQPKQKPEPEKETFTAWGKEVGGLQAGLGYRPGEKRAYSHGEGVTLVLRVRNVGKEVVEFKHIGAFFVENPPTITDADGKMVQLPRLGAEGKHLPHSTNLAPGKEVKLFDWNFDLRPKGESGNKGPRTIHGTGKFILQCERIVGPTSFNPNHPNPTLDKLATGKLELEIKSDPPPAAPEKKEPPKQEKERDKDLAGLEGKWDFISEEHDGEKRESMFKSYQFTFKGKEVTTAWVRDDDNTGGGTMHFVIDSTKDPKELTISGDNIKIQAVYKLDKDQLTMALFGKPEDARPKGFTAADAAGEGRILVVRVLKRADQAKEGKASDKPPTTPENTSIPESARNQFKEGFTAWGKEVGGLQAGLGYPPDQKRAYSHGETVKLVVWVRNVSKEAASITYFPQFFIDTPPAVTDSQGKPVTLRRVDAGFVDGPVKVNLAPGKEIDLYELKLDARTGFQSGNVREWTLFGTGKFQIRYERVFGNSAAGQLVLDPNLKKLATGKLELEIKDDPFPIEGATKKAEPFPIEGATKKADEIKSDPQPAATEKKADEPDSKRLQGTWHVVEMEEGGVARPEDHYKKTRFVVTDKTLAIKSPVPDGGDAVEEMTFVLDEKAQPKRLDAQKDGRTIIGIYTLEEGSLKLCVDLDGDNRPTGFKTKKGSRQRLYVLKRRVDSKNEGRGSDLKKAKDAPSSEEFDDAEKLLESALKLAKGGKKRVLLIACTKSCLPCRQLDELFAEIKPVLDKHLILAKLDLKDMEHADDVHRRFRKDIDEGPAYMPWMVILDDSAQPLAMSGKLKQGRSDSVIGLPQGGEADRKYFLNMLRTACPDITDDELGRIDKAAKALHDRIWSKTK